MDRDGIVVSRVSPEEKLRIGRALRKRGHVVAMTGDGVNDAPALHQADIGIAMGLSGTDVAREAADLVLLDDNFATIVAAIEQGRTTFANARRFLTYHLADNIAELTPFVVWALSGGRFPLALGVLQVLCLDIGTDILPAVALGAEPSSPRALAQPPLGRHLVDGSLLFRAFGVLGLTESIVEMVAFLASLLFAGWRPGLAFPSGICASFSLRRCFHRGRCWPDGECLCLPQCQPMARKTRLVFESIPCDCHILRSRDANWFSIYFSTCESTGASCTKYGRLRDGSAGDSGSPRRRCGPKTMEETTIIAKSFRTTFPTFHFGYAISIIGKRSFVPLFSIGPGSDDSAQLHFGFAEGNARKQLDR